MRLFNFSCDERSMASTQDLSRWPGIGELKKRTQSLAMLDAIMMRDWELRYYSFNCKWAPREQMASMRNGQGDGWFCVFGESGAFLKGFDHESEMSPWRTQPPKIWPGVLDDVPAAFSSFRTQAAFAMDETTFCVWRRHGDPAWQRGTLAFPPGEDPDGSARLLSMLDGKPETYQHWGETYYERPLDLSAVRHIYARKTLTPDIVRALNHDIELSDLSDDAEEIGYPLR
jgi:hypothetical protein